MKQWIEIETLGIERSYSKLELAAVVLLVVDTQNPYPIVFDRIKKIRERIADGQTLIIVANKIDSGEARNHPATGSDWI